MLDIIWRLFEHKEQLMQDGTAILAAIVAFCAALSAALPPATQPGLYATFRDLVNKVGQNYGYAKNANDARKKPNTPPFI